MPEYTGILSALGGLIGGIFFAGLGSALKRGLSASTPPLDAKAHTIHTKFDITPDHVFLAYEGLCLALIGGFSVFGLNRSAPLLHPMIGGALIGGAQAASLLLTGNAIGVSTAYDEAGRFFWNLFAPEKQGGHPPTKAMMFALGMLIASFALSQSTVHTTLQMTGISGVRALLNGCTTEKFRRISLNSFRDGSVNTLSICPKGCLHFFDTDTWVFQFIHLARYSRSSL